MRDPHVVALHYTLETGPQLAFNDPAPLEKDKEAFTLRLADGHLRVEMKDHFATMDAARLEVQPYLQAWEIATALQHGPGALRFALQRAEVIDRNPSPPGDPITGVVIQTLSGAMVFATATVTIPLRNYPEPPVTFKASPEVFDLWTRYLGYRASTEHLPSMAYYCATAVQHTAAGKTISSKVISHLRYLSTMVGTPQTLRKREAGQELREHTPVETAWMEAVVKRIIQRVGEWAADPNAQWPQITMEEFARL
jgi:hypothetical protein